jgi:RNA polymerase sigma-70 factor (ECF subfamily)
MDDLEPLVTRAQGGDRAAIEELTTRSRPPIFYYALKLLGNHADADTLTQEVQLHALRKLHLLRDARRYVPWVRRITLNMVMEHRRRVRRVVVLSNLGQDPDYLDTHPDPRDWQGEVDVAQALETLRPEAQQAISRYYLWGQSLPEIATDTGVLVGTLKSRLHTARQTLKEKMGAPC